jgi:transposase
VAYLSAYQHIPVDRIAQMLFDEYDVTVSTGAIVAMIAEGAELLKPFTAEVKRQLATAPLACADETGLNAKGLKWVHTLSTDKLTLYHLDEKRGYAAMLAAGVLSSFKGVLVHDGWGAYRKLVNVIHALCNAHHIRELVGVEENTTQAWPAAMRKLLSDAYVAVCEAKQKGDAQLTDEQLARVTLRYRLIVMLGHLENPEPTRVAGRHGRVKRTKAANLLRRLGVYEADVLRFAHDFAVPFDNNLAERDIRMVKVHQKISGCFRSTGGAENFLALRSYLSTARKNDVGLLGSLQLLFEGQPWLPLG